jgi:flagellar biosynthetic protein FliR
VNSADAALLATLPDWAFAFVLVLGRVGAAMTLLPGLGEADALTMVRAGIALGVTVLLLPGIAPLVPPVPVGLLPAAGMIASEVVTGLWLGWLARVLVLALPMTGQFLSYMLGVSNVLQIDAEMGAQVTVLARLFSLVAPVALMVSGLYALPLAALAGSYRLIAPGALLPSGDTAAVAVSAVAQAFELALRLASPFILASIVWHVAVGLLARLVPRVQVYFASMPGQILGGLVLLAALSAALLATWQEAVRAGFAALPGLS